MKRLPSIFLAVAAFGLVPALVSPAVASSGASAPAAAADPQPAVTSMIVAYEPGVAPTETTGEASGSTDVTVTAVAPGAAIGFGLRTVTLADPLSIESAEALASELELSPEIAWAEPDRVVTLDATADLTASQVISAGGLWGLDRIDQRALPLDATYQYLTEGAGVTAYVIDTGILSTHTEFAGRVLPGANFAPGVTGTEDCEGHGTHVSGIIGGNTYGVAKKVNLVPVRVFPCSSSTLVSDVISGINFVVGDHAAGTPAVANMSLSVSPTDAGLDLAVQSMVNDGITVVVASGNANTDACATSPAHVATAITVNASTSLDTFATFSNFGPCTDLYAPGDTVLSAGISVDPTTLIATQSAPTILSGTSMASPHVAGAAARILSASPALTPAQVSTAITSAATVPAPSVARNGTDPNRILYLGPTSAPRTVAAAPADLSTVVTWVSPLLSGGTALASYTATAWNAPTGGTPVATCQPSPLTALTCTVTGLANGTTYYVDALATNADGSSVPSARAAVTPRARPTAPQSVNATAAVTSAEITWAAPSSDGGSAITSYTATAWSAASAGVSRGTCQPSPLTGLGCTITGLANGTTYYVDAVATNAAGPSVPSARSAVTPVAPLTAPTAPRSLAAVAGDGSAALTWIAPSSPGGSAITSYTATAWDAAVGGTNRGTCQPSPLTGLGCTISGLTNATTYYVDAVATNGSGPSMPSARVAVTPVAPTPPAGGGGGGSAGTSSSASSDGGGGGAAAAPTVAVAVAPVATPPTPIVPAAPSTPTPVVTVAYVGPAGAGLVRPTAAQAASVRLTTVASAAATAGKAPTATAKRGSVVRLSVPGLPAMTKVAVQIKVGGSYVRLGSVTTSAKGRATLPALKPTKPGTYLLRITDPSGAAHYVKLIVN